MQLSCAIPACIPWNPISVQLYPYFFLIQYYYTTKHCCVLLLYYYYYQCNYPSWWYLVLSRVYGLTFILLSCCFYLVSLLFITQFMFFLLLFDSWAATTNDFSHCGINKVYLILCQEQNDKNISTRQLDNGKAGALKQLIFRDCQCAMHPVSF